MPNIEQKKAENLKIISDFHELTQNQIENIEEFVILLLKENNNFNLIGKSTIPEIWNRHILDSAQILKYIDDKRKKIADLGTGAGFPGIVISIFGVKEVHLIEKSVRKCQFLRKAKVISPNQIFIHQSKIEEIENQKYHIITSRALASLDKLLQNCLKFLDQDGYGLFLKGKSLEKEIAEAKKTFNFDYELHPSLTSSESQIIKVRNIKKI